MTNHLAAVPAGVRIGLIGLVAWVVALFLLAVWSSAPAAEKPGQTARAALGLALVMGATAVAALSGALADPARRPPAFPVVMALCTAVTVFAARSRLGARIAELPSWMLVGAQSFRLPLEVFVMHGAARAGVIPVEMSYDGLNFDVVTGATALLVAAVLYRGSSPRLALAWNVLGSVLLAVIVGVAMAATPFIHAFGPKHLNTGVFHFPLVWLPTVLVQAALFGHIVIFRRLTALRTTPERPGQWSAPPSVM